MAPHDQRDSGKGSNDDEERLLGTGDAGMDGSSKPAGDAAEGASGVAIGSGAMRVLLALVVSLSWMCASSGLILINRTILKDMKFPYPMAVSSMGMLASGLLSLVTCRLHPHLAASGVDVTPRFYLTRMMPVGFFMAGTLWAGNTVYLYLTVALIQMLKAFTPVMTMLALFLSGLETPSRAMVASVLVIAAGVVLTVTGEVSASMVGLLLMFISEATEALRLVMTQYLLTGLKMGPFEGVMYLAPACFVWLTLGSAVVEWRTIQARGSLSVPMQTPGLFVVAAFMGFAVNVLAYATIKLASSLTLKVLGTVKNALLIVVAMALYAEVVTPLQAGGYTLSVCAFGVYTRLKMGQIAAGG